MEWIQSDIKIWSTQDRSRPMSNHKRFRLRLWHHLDGDQKVSSNDKAPWGKVHIHYFWQAAVLQGKNAALGQTKGMQKSCNEGWLPCADELFEGNWTVHRVFWTCRHLDWEWRFWTNYYYSTFWKESLGTEWSMPTNSLWLWAVLWKCFTNWPQQQQQMLPRLSRTRMTAFWRCPLHHCTQKFGNPFMFWKTDEQCSQFSQHFRSGELKFETCVHSAALHTCTSGRWLASVSLVICCDAPMVCSIRSRELHPMGDHLPDWHKITLNRCTNDPWKETLTKETAQKCNQITSTKLVKQLGAYRYIKNRHCKRHIVLDVQWKTIAVEGHKSCVQVGGWWWRWRRGAKARVLNGQLFVISWNDYHTNIIISF